MWFDDQDASDYASGSETVTAIGTPVAYPKSPQEQEQEHGRLSDECTALLGAERDRSRHDCWVGEELDGFSWRKRPSVWWLIPPYAVFTLAFGGAIVPKINLILGLVCAQYFSDRQAADPTLLVTSIKLGGDNGDQCLLPTVQRKVALFTLVLSVVSGLLSALTAPRMGSLSDRHGRKRLMVLCSLGGIAGEIVTIFAGKYPDRLDYRILVLAYFLDGLTGSFIAGSLLSHSYTSDCTPPSKRSVAYGYLHACLFSGIAFGPLLAAKLVEKTNDLLSIFYLTLGCHIVFVLFIGLVLPESLSRRQQLLARQRHEKERIRATFAPSPWMERTTKCLAGKKRVGDALMALRTANPFAPLKALLPKGSHNAVVRRNLVILALIDMTMMGAAMSSGTVLVLYTEYMFHWRTPEASRFFSLTSFIRVVVLLALFPIVHYVFRVRLAKKRTGCTNVAPMENNAGADGLDVWLLRIALSLDILGITGYIFVRTPSLFILSGATATVGGFGAVCVQSALTKHVPAERVGQLLGATGFLHALARVVGPMLFNGLYAATVERFPQAFFLLLVSMFAACWAASMVVRPHLHLVEDGTEPLPARSERETESVIQSAQHDEDLLPA